MRVAKQKPLNEITLRRYEPPYDMDERDLIKYIALSLGLINPGDSRDIIVDILTVIIKNRDGLSFTEIEKKVYELRESLKLPLIGITPPNIHRQLKRLKDLYIIEKFGDVYRLSEKMSFKDVFNKKVRKIIIEPTLQRIEEYLDRLDKSID